MQVPWGVEALSGKISERAWKTKPSWYLIVTDDKMIPPDAQRFMSRRAGSTVAEVKGSHAIYVSQPKAVAALVEQAAKSVKTLCRRLVTSEGLPLDTTNVCHGVRSARASREALLGSAVYRTTAVNRRFHPEPGRGCNGNVTPATRLDSNSSIVWT